MNSNQYNHGLKSLNSFKISVTLMIAVTKISLRSKFRQGNAYIKRETGMFVAV
jgi:hypothetical protein